MADNGKNDPQMFNQILQVARGDAPDAFDFTTEPAEQGGAREATALGGPDTKDSFLPMESIRPTESLLDADYGPDGNLGLLGTSDAFASSDFHLI
jgi:hypothetical protein